MSASSSPAPVADPASASGPPPLRTSVSKKALQSKWEEPAEPAEAKRADVVKLTFPDGRVVELPLLEPVVGPPGIDVRGLYAASGYFTYDPGFTSTASCQSSITYIDGPKGELLYRGYAIEELAEHSSFDDVSYLLLYGELPDAESLVAHRQRLVSHTMVHEKLMQFYHGFKNDAHPMAIMVGVVGALSAFYHDSLDISDAEHRSLAAYRLLAKMPTIAAMAYKTSVGQPFVYPNNSLGYSENFLHMMFALPSEDYVVDATHARAMETFLILHMDHEQNASTSTVRIAGSSKANPFACIASGIAALWGPAHGGANEAVLRMLDEIGSKENIPAFLERAKDKKDPFRLMGFGHRVYKNYDPRSVHMKKLCHEVLAAHGAGRDPLLELAMELEKAALADPYFVDRKLFPNVDFYSGICLRAMGIPVSMFTVLFAVARTVGWVSQWKEMIEDPLQRIGRPRQLYTGSERRDFVAVPERPRSTTTAVGSDSPTRHAGGAGAANGIRVKPNVRRPGGR